MAEAKFLAPLYLSFLGLFFAQILSKSQNMATLDTEDPCGCFFYSSSSMKPLEIAEFTGLLRFRNLTTSIQVNTYGKRSKNLTRFVTTLLLLSGDIQLNPGPAKYPCGQCSKPVKSNQRGILCDFCDVWFHARCLNIDKIAYNALANSSCVWGCPTCGLPNYSTSLLSSVSDLQSPNKFTAIQDNKDLHCSLPDNITSPITSQRNYASPQNQSTPKRQKFVTKRQKPTNIRIKCMEINCNSILSSERSSLFKAFVEHHQPDVIFGCESKLSPDIPSAACFPQGYSIYRKERSCGRAGGVFLAISLNLTSISYPEFSTDAESIWASIKCGSKELYLCSFYKPPSSPITATNNITDVLSHLHQKSHRVCPSAIISGDFNVGDIDWKADPPISLSADGDYLLDFMDEYSLTQSVTMPTRPVSGKTLDLVLSTIPSLVSNVQTHPGMSDHDIVTFTINTKPSRVNKPSHKVYLYNRMNLEGLKCEVSNISNTFFQSSPQNRNVDENWTLFKTSLLKAVDTYIPSKMTKAKSSLPWVTRHIKRHMRKRDKLHSLAKHSNNPTLKASYRKHPSRPVIFDSL